MNDQVQPRAPREWVELTTITSEVTPVVVRVQTTASGRPLYSMEIGILRDGRVLRHMPVYTQSDGSVAPADSATLVAMIKAAENAVAVDAKRKADEWAARRPVRNDERDRGGREERRGGRSSRGRKARADREDGSRWR